LQQELSKYKHAGIAGRTRDEIFQRGYQINLDKLFTEERHQARLFSEEMKECDDIEHKQQSSKAS
jgi:hypothetical protein